MRTATLFKLFLANQGQEIGYTRIKKVEDTLISFGKQGVESPLSYLMATGVIDKSGRNGFKLSTTCILIKDKFALGVNLPRSITSGISDGILADNDSGLLILDAQTINTELGATVSHFDLCNVIKHFRPIRKQVNDLLLTGEKFYPKPGVQVFHPVQQKWLPFDNFCSKAENLFRIPISKHHFFYRFETNSSYSDEYRSIVFQRWDLDLLAAVKIRLCLSNGNCGLTYNSRTSILRVRRFFPFPLQIRKLLFANHVLCTGEFPIGDAYFLDKMVLIQLNKIFDNQIENDHE